MQKGQVILIVVLVMVVALTVGLSLVGRSVIQIKNSNEEQNSQKAFQAAESGIEIGLQKPLVSQDFSIGQKTLDNNSIIQSVNVHTISGSSITLNNGNPVSKDQGADVWLTSYPNFSGQVWSGQLYVYWGTKNGCQDAAIEAVVISGLSASDPNMTIKKYGADPCGSNSIDVSQNRTGDNKFSPAQIGTSVNGQNFKFSTAITLNNGLIVRIIPLYVNTPIAVVGYTNAGPPALQSFPSQGRIITATGSFSTSTRKVSFFQGFPMLPSEFFYAVFQQ